MSSDQKLPIKFAECVEFVIPPFDTRPAVPLSFKSISEGEQRLVEARVVNPSTYKDLEFSFNEGYREAKANLSVVGYEIAQAKKTIRKIKSEHLLDEYPAFIKERKLNDNTANREAFLERQQDYVDANDRLDMLLALESLLDGKVKVFENVCRYMKQSMRLIERSGMDPNKY